MGNFLEGNLNYFVGETEFKYIDPKEGGKQRKQHKQAGKGAYTVNRR